MKNYVHKIVFTKKKVNSHKVYFRFNIFSHERRFSNSECISAEQYRFLYIVLYTLHIILHRIWFLQSVSTSKTVVVLFPYLGGPIQYTSLEWKTGTEKINRKSSGSSGLNGAAKTWGCWGLAWKTSTRSLCLKCNQPPYLSQTCGKLSFWCQCAGRSCRNLNWQTWNQKAQKIRILSLVFYYVFKITLDERGISTTFASRCHWRLRMACKACVASKRSASSAACPTNRTWPQTSWPLCLVGWIEWLE